MIQGTHHGGKARAGHVPVVTHWPVAVLVTSAAIVAAGQWVASAAASRVMSVLLLALIVATVLSLRTALTKAVRSLTAAHKEQLESERRYRVLFDACSDAIAVFPLEDGGVLGQIAEVNQAACRALGYQRAELLAKSAPDIMAPEVRNDIAERLLALGAADHLVFETVYVTSEGRRFPVEVSVRVRMLRGQRLCLAIARNIAQRKEREQHWRSLSHEDQLTGLLNRRGFFVMAEQTARRARRLWARPLLMYLDVDGLKGVNDRLGHTTGDALLSAAADVLRSTFREEDVVARLGGDEFVALALLDHGDERLKVQAIEMRLERALRKKRAELGDAFNLSLSYGTLLASYEELTNIEELLARSDELMYQVKQSRRRQALEACDQRPSVVPATDAPARRAASAPAANVQSRRAASAGR